MDKTARARSAVRSTDWSAPAASIAARSSSAIDVSQSPNSSAKTAIIAGWAQEQTCRVVLPARDRSLGNDVLVDNAVLHDDQKLVCRVGNEVNIFQWIAVDYQEISQGTLFDDSQFAGIRVAQA
jgi:hypothetical protein